ncbi:hypothetical protein QR680_002455 [Steinernema hermaphroditum]|uniref:Solute carrier family 13 member 5 n=1 Tax=Steinernema hermaphroditum TaxID=289476 RepID=A0AA39H2T4_9BILA|nr:hypothetical protein QR680_002455 [Steinernema hermaphroditum]
MAISETVSHWRASRSWHLCSAAKRQLVCFLLPLILLPFPLLEGSKEAKCAYVVLVMGIFWMTEILPLAVTALLPVIMYPLLGVVTAKKISTEYLSDANFIFFGSLVMAVGVENSNLHERIALRILVSSGSNPRWLMLGFQVATCLLSMWISNTATTAMMVPIAMAVINELEQIRSQRTPRANKNQVADCEQHIGDDSRSKTPESDENVYKAMLLCICYSASIGGTGTLIGTGPNIVLSDDLNKMYGGLTDVTFISWIWFAIPQMVLSITFCWLWLQFLFIGFRRNLQSEKDEAVHNMLRRKYENLGRMRFNEKLIALVFICLVLLWFFRQPKIIPGWGSLFLEGYVTDGTSAMTAAILLFVLPAENPFIVRVDQAEIKTLMDWNVMKNRFSWSTLLLLGGGYAMAAGVRESGLSDWIGAQMTTITTLPEWIFVLISCAMITALTEFSSNVATASIFLPLLSTIARQNHTNPLLYMLPATLSCSYSFMFPAGTPPNAIVFGSKMLKVIDMAKAGIVLNMFSLVMTVLFTHTYAYWLFNLGDYPSWANRANSTTQA